MLNAEYFELLERRLKKMNELRDIAKQITTGVAGDTLFIEDLFFTSALNRSVELLDGQLIMLKERNLTCAGAFLRMLVDNCMRIFAAFIAEDRETFIDKFIAGNKISDFRDSLGNKMNDAYLIKKLVDYDSQISSVYKKLRVIYIFLKQHSARI